MPLSAQGYSAADRKKNDTRHAATGLKKPRRNSHCFVLRHDGYKSRLRPRDPPLLQTSGLFARM
jgi:hypothetical protein